MLVQDHFEHFRGIVERYSEMLYPALFFEFVRLLVRAALLKVPVILSRLSMHQIKIKIVDAAFFKLILKERAYVRGALEIAARKFVRQYVTLSRITLYKTLPDGIFALFFDIAARRIEIVESLSHKKIDHLFGFLVIHLFPFHRQTHTAESQFLLHVIKDH